jgi:Holliday junction resolvasome RuvABC endonuclease subunit
MSTENIILSLDQATSSGYCISVGDEIVKYGLIKSKGADYHLKTRYLQEAVESLVEEYGVTLITVETPGGGNRNIQVFGKLMGLFFCTVDLALRLDLKYVAFAPSTWRSAIGMKTGRGVKRAELKQMAIAYVNENTEFTLTDKQDDEGEAICQNVAIRKILKEK